LDNNQAPTIIVGDRLMEEELVNQFILALQECRIMQIYAIQNAVMDLEV